MKVLRTHLQHHYAYFLHSTRLKDIFCYSVAGIYPSKKCELLKVCSNALKGKRKSGLSRKHKLSCIF